MTGCQNSPTGSRRKPASTRNSPLLITTGEQAAGEPEHREHGERVRGRRSRGPAPRTAARRRTAPSASPPATLAATTSGTNARVENSNSSSSIASTTAASGAPNVAAMPAAAPQASRILRSAGETWSTCPSSEPSAPPVTMIGPSAPNGPPVPMAIAADSGLATRRARRDPALLACSTASIASGMPWPRIVGAHRASTRRRGRRGPRPRTTTAPGAVSAHRRRPGGHLLEQSEAGEQADQLDEDPGGERAEQADRGRDHAQRGNATRGRARERKGTHLQRIYRVTIRRHAHRCCCRRLSAVVVLPNRTTQVPPLERRRRRGRGRRPRPVPTPRRGEGPRSRDGPPSIGQIAEQLLVRQNSASELVHRAEESGLVRTRPDRHPITARSAWRSPRTVNGCLPTWRRCTSRSSRGSRR